MIQIDFGLDFISCQVPLLGNQVQEKALLGAALLGTWWVHYLYQATSHGRGIGFIKLHCRQAINCLFVCLFVHSGVKVGMK